MTETLHNAPPAVDPESFAEMKKRLDQLNELTGEWLAIKELTTADQSRKLTDVVTAARKLAKDIDDRRKKDKEPWLTRGREVDGAYRGLSDPIDLITKKLKSLQAAWLAKEAEKARKAKAEEDARLRKEREELEKRAREAEERLDMKGIAEAEAAAKDLAKQEKAAARPAKVSAGSQTGGGRTMSLVRRAYAKVVDPTRCFLHYRSHPEVTALLERLATADARIKGFEGTIPGCEITYKEEAR